MAHGTGVFKYGHFLAAASICIGEILPTEFLNQWVTDSQVGRFSFHFLQCRARGAELGLFPGLEFESMLVAHKY